MLLLPNNPPNGAGPELQRARGLPHQQRRHNPSDRQPRARRPADKHDKEVAEQKRLQEEEDRQLARAVYESEMEYPPLPGAKGDKMDIIGEDQVNGGQSESENVVAEESMEHT